MNLKGKPKPVRVLVFNPKKILIGVFASYLHAAKALKTHTQSIFYACNGTCIGHDGWYFRAMPESYDISINDIGSLTLTDFDKANGIERTVYPDERMIRTGTKYKRHKNES